MTISAMSASLLSLTMMAATTGYKEPNVCVHDEIDDSMLLPDITHDPEVAGLSLWLNKIVIAQVDRAGCAIGNSMYLKKLEIKFSPLAISIELVTSFFKHVAQNLSIMHLEISRDHSIAGFFLSLFPFF